MNHKFILFLLLLSHIGFCQVSVSTSPSTPDPSTILDVKAIDKGLLIPRMTLADRNNISLPAHSLLIYQTDNSPGYYYNTGTSASPVWTKFVSTQSLLQHIGKTPIESLPFTISQSGSYYLTQGLTGASGIVISASNVYIDMNGHTLSGSVGNSVAGISTSAAYTNLTVVNGQITGWGREGINFSNSSACKFDNLHISGNARDGLFSGKNTVVSNCVSTTNSQDGIDVGESSVVINCIAEANINDGIECDNGSICESSTCKSNTLVGIKSTASANIKNCQAVTNGTYGFQLGIGTEASSNGAIGNSSHGYFIQAGCKLTHNQARANTLNGFELSGGDIVLEHCSAISNSGSGFVNSYNLNHFIENTAIGNSIHGFNISGSSNLIIKNKASNNTTTGFTVTAPNILGTILTSSATVNANTNPNANISF
jgi:hypothetical protein